MFSQASVILFTDTCQTPPPPGQTRPLTDTCPGQTPPPPGRHPPWADIRPGQTPSSRQQLQQMVCILLECILVTVRKRSCIKVMFLHLSASHSVHCGGGVSASVHAGMHRPEQTPPPQRTVRILVEFFLVLNSNHIFLESFTQLRIHHWCTTYI